MSLSFNRNILITINVTSGYNDAYIQKAKEKLAQYHDSRLFLLYVLDRTDFFDTEFPHALSKFLSDQNHSLTHARNRLNQFGEQLNVPYEHRILAQGNPNRTILNEATLLKADLIIIGNHSPDASHLTGSTCRFVTEHANCDALALHISAGEPTVFVHPQHIELPPETQANAA